MVSIMQHTALWTSPFAIRKFQIVIDESAVVATLRRRKEAVDDDETLTIPKGLVGQLAPELSVGCIHPGLRLLGFRKAFDAQVLDADALKQPDDPDTVLMQKVATTIGNPSMDAGHPTLRFLPSVASLLSSRHSTLSTGKSTFISTKELRRRDLVFQTRGQS